jgi:putative tryptophan/tyrosine transport system substrate-binding protein
MKRLLIADFRWWSRAPAIFTVALAFGLLAAPLPSDGQQPAKVYRIGLLSTVGPAPADRTPQDCPIKGSPNWQALVEGLRERGYIQGQNLVIECRWTEGHPERAPALAAEFVSLKVDLLVVFSSANVRAAKQATSTIPIVMVGVIDPVGRGLVASLARPGGNVTGLTDDAGTEIVGKYLQLLKEAVPTASCVAVLGYSGSAAMWRTETEAAARKFDLTLHDYEVQEPSELDGAFAAMTKARTEALVVLPAPFMWAHAPRIVDLAARSRLPAVYPGRDHVEAGGLLAYDIDRRDIWRRIGLYADKIFKRAKPGDLPVEQPTKFNLIINLKTAKALGIAIPQSLLLRADALIQ